MVLAWAELKFSHKLKSLVCLVVFRSKYFQCPDCFIEVLKKEVGHGKRIVTNIHLLDQSCKMGLNFQNFLSLNSKIGNIR